MDFNDVLHQHKEDLAKVEEAIRNNYYSDVDLIPDISEYMFGGGGKRVRPLLLMISNQLCGAPIDERVIKHCVVVEYIHNATLLHDDVVDETTLRRGNQTVNTKWGSDASILTGDFLISRAILLLAYDHDSRIIKAIAESSKVLVEGGILEFTNARKLNVTEETLIDIAYRKTASIMSVSCELGGLLADADEQTVQALVSFGNDFGVAFQLADDVMDYDSNEELLGKPAGNDLVEGHVTLPLWYLYSNSNARLKKEIEGFIQSDNLTQKELDYVLDRMRETKAIEYTLEKAKFHLDRAKTTLQKTRFRDPKHRDALIAVAEHIIDRYTVSKAYA